MRTQLVLKLITTYTGACERRVLKNASYCLLFNPFTVFHLPLEYKALELVKVLLFETVKGVCMKLSYIFKATIGSLVFFLALNLKAQTTPAVGSIKSELISLINTTDVQNKLKKLGSQGCRIDENSDIVLEIEERSRLLALRDYLLNNIHDLNSMYELINLLDISEVRSRLLALSDYLSDNKDDLISEYELLNLLDTLEDWPSYAQQKYYFTVRCPDKKIYNLIVWNIKEKNKMGFLKLDSINQLYQAL